MRGIFNFIFLIILMVFLVISIVGIVFIPLYFFFVFVGAAKRKRKVASKVSTILMDGERVAASAIEYRAISLFRRRRAVFLTDSRVIYIRRKLFGGFKMIDRKWKELDDAQMDENILPGLSGTALSFSFVSPPGGFFRLAGVSPDEAARVYTYAQSQEQAWEEKRRVRDLEEKRAASGGVNFHGFSQQAAPTQPVLVSGETIDASPSDTVAVEINRAKALLESGSISDSEFQEIKSKILSRYF